MRVRDLLLLVLLITTFAMPRPAAAQVSRVIGIVRDSLTCEPVPFASVLLVGTDRGMLTGDDGRFDISTAKQFTAIEVSAMGFTTKRMPLRPGKSNRVTVDVVPTGVILNEVVAKPKKEHYSKKNNPAVAFMEKIRATMDINDPRSRENYNYRKYERITFALNDFHVADSASGDDGGFLIKQFPWMAEHLDVSEVSGNPILNVITREKASEIYYRKDPESEKEIIEGFKTGGLDDLVDQESLQKAYEDVLREVDVYQNDITILQNRFVSPLSRIAPDFYKFYLTDTVTIDTTRCVELTFVPHNPASMGFTGRFYVIEGDSTMFIKRLELHAPHDINLNFIDNMLIRQDYDRAPDGTRLKTRDDLILEASVIPGMQGLYARRNTVYSDHSFTPPADEKLFSMKSPSRTLPEAGSRDEAFWETRRLSKISKSEKSVNLLMARLRSNKVYYWSEKTLRVLVGGYVHTAPKSKFDIGPVNTFISYNDLEGLRLKAGGMTTANLSRRWFARGYGAYGFKDHKWKYKGELEYSFRDKKYHSREFPVHSLRATHLYDIDMLGQDFVATNPDNIFLSLRRKKDTQITYHRVSSLEYILELENNFSVEAKLQNERQYATRDMTFVDGNGTIFPHYTLNTLTLKLRYAPGEKFFQGKSSRRPINLDAPVFTLSHTVAPRGLFGNRFTLNKTEASFSKRFWFSAFGYTDVILKGAHVWSRVPYPNLIIPNSNLSYIIQPEAFALLNPMEFINDTYAMWDVTYWANGAILNNIPLLKRLKLREAFSFRGFFGRLSERNNPASNPELFRFPEIAHTQRMNPRTPYMEVGVGVDNILRILRVDYVWRLTYRHTPDACLGGIRIAAHFSF